MQQRRSRTILSAVAALAVASAGLLVAPTATAQTDDPAPPPQEERFQKVLIEDQGLTQPMRLAAAPDGRVVYIERDGRVKVWEPETHTSVVAGTVPVRVTGEAGLIGLALAPDFAETGHLYLHFSRPDWAESFITRVSRFTLSTDSVLDLNSEQVVIDIQHPEGVSGGHSAGDMLATEDGYLFIATGDNTNCCASRGFPGADERPGEEGSDAQRTSANTNDLNGKVLRIIPSADGAYDIPEDNLFPVGEYPADKTRPEIYAMGFRNPFTLGDWDSEAETLWMADYGPDAILADPERGPAGHVNIHLIEEPGNFGWPYCTMNNVPYNDWDYVNDEPGPWFDCDNPINDSPNNTGLVELPPITPATIYYTYDTQEYFPELFGGGAMAGPRYQFDADNPSETKFPEWFDGRRFFYDWTTDWVQTTGFTGSDPMVPNAMQRFLPDGDFRKPMDMEFGPDGALYVLEYGNGWGASNDDSGIYRIDYVEGNRTPSAIVSTDVDSGQLPLEVTFDASASTDPDGDELTVTWDVDGDGEADGTGPTFTHTFTEAGEHAVQATVTDPDGAAGFSTVTVVAGNTRPTIEIELPRHGGFSEFGEALPYRIAVTDPEDGEIDCANVSVTYALGHNTHAHPMGESTPDENCEGVLEPGRDAEHGPGAYVFHVVDARYTDGGGAEGAPTLSASANIVLHPRELAARTYPRGEGVGLYYGQLFVPGSGNWFSFPTFDMHGVDSVDLTVATRLAGATLEVRAGGPTGPLVAQLADIPATGSTSLHDRVDQTFTVPVTDPGGVHDLYFVGTWDTEEPPELFVRSIVFTTVDDYPGPGPDPDPEPEPEPTALEFHLSNGWRGTTDVFFRYGRIADEVFVGDWDGDGVDTIALRRGNVFHVTNGHRGGEAEQVFTYGRPGDVVLVGDWDGDGRDTFAVRRGSAYHVKNRLIGGEADVVVHYGRAADEVLVGDWDGDDQDTFTVRRGNTYHVKDVIAGGDADHRVVYGRAGDVTLAGDWDGDGRDTFAVRRGATYHVKNSLRGGDADITVTFGRHGDDVLVGDWNGDGTDTLGIRRPGSGDAAD